MTTLLLDTNIVSFLMKNDSLARLYRPHLANHPLALSFMSLAELYEGAFRADWGPNKRSYLDHIEDFFVVALVDPTCAYGGVKFGRFESDTPYRRTTHGSQPRLLKTIGRL